MRAEGVRAFCGAPAALLFPNVDKLRYYSGMPEKNDFRLDYVEFGCTDTVRVKSFYHAVFGWHFTDYGPGYTCFNDGRLRGGFTTELKPGDGSPLAVIYAWDLKKIQTKIVAAGGSVVKEAFYFPGGSRFHFADPEGNVLAVWSDAQAPA
jgi:predicted enzyme related to lactoylglutathione lyase